MSKQECVEGDLFDSVLNIEHSSIESGYNAGIEYGKELGIAEGKVLGIKRGIDIGNELGFYSAYAVTTIQLIEHNPSINIVNKARLLKQLNNLSVLINNFPMIEPQNIHLDEQLSLIRSKFRLCIQIEQVFQYFKSVQQQQNESINTNTSANITAAQVERSF